MGLLGDLLVKGVSMALGEDTAEIFGGDGTGEKKALFEKLLGKWNNIFQDEDFFTNAEYDKSKEAVEMPIRQQVNFSQRKVKIESRYRSILGEANKKSQQSPTHIKSEKGEIDFVCLRNTPVLYFGSRNMQDYSTGNFVYKIEPKINENERPFYYFKYTKGDNTLEFRYELRLLLDNKNLLNASSQDILTLTFKSGEEILTACVYWQPEVSWEMANGSEPKAFFKRLDKADVYENLQKFIEKASAPLIAAQKEEEKRKKAAEEEKRQKKEDEEKQNRRLKERTAWEQKAKELSSKSKVESALDSFLDSDDDNESENKGQEELAESYLQKGRDLQEQDEDEEAFEAFGIASALGSLKAKFELADCYLYGIGTECDEKAAFHLYTEMAEQGYVPAQRMLAVCYAHGLGTEENEELTYEWYKKATEQGDAVAQDEFTFLDKENETADLYKEAAEQGDAEAQYKLAYCYYSENKELFFSWHKKAAEQGYAKAQYEVGDCYLNGIGTEKNEEMAFEWYKKAAEQGHALAQYELGDCYSFSIGTKENNEFAFKWYKKAAENGYERAMNSLCSCYECGSGTEENEKKAIKWYKKLAKQGDEIAADWLKEHGL